MYFCIFIAIIQLQLPKGNRKKTFKFQLFFDILKTITTVNSKLNSAGPQRIPSDSAASDTDSLQRSVLHPQDVTLSIF